MVVSSEIASHVGSALVIPAGRFVREPLNRLVRRFTVAVKAGIEVDATKTIVYMLSLSYALSHDRRGTEAKEMMMRLKDDVWIEPNGMITLDGEARQIFADIAEQEYGIDRLSPNNAMTVLGKLSEAYYNARIIHPLLEV